MSLRDVERVLEVMSWFYKQTQGDTDLFKLMKAKKEAGFQEEVKNIEKIVEDESHQVSVFVDFEVLFYPSGLRNHFGLCHFSSLLKQTLKNKYRIKMCP